MNLRKRTWEIVELAKRGDKGSRLFDISILVLIFLNVVAVIVGSVQSIQEIVGAYFSMHSKRYRLSFSRLNTSPDYGLVLLIYVLAARFSVAFA